MNRIKIDNVNKKIILTNSAFENPTVEEKQKIEKYLAIKYDYDIIDDQKKKVGKTLGYTDELIKTALIANSKELGLDEKKSAECIALYNALCGASFQKGKSFFIELCKVEKKCDATYLKRNPAKHKSYEELIKWYGAYCKQNGIEVPTATAKAEVPNKSK